MFLEGTGCERGGAKPANGSGLKMKLRDFMVNSLPRVRSRKKQKQQQLLQQQQQSNRSQVLNNGNLDENRNTYSIETIESSNRLDPYYHGTSSFKRISSESIRSELEELKIEKSRLSANSDDPNVNLNVITDSTDNNKCLCFKHMTNSYGPNDVVLGLGIGYCADEDGAVVIDPHKDSYNTVPKVRSKIRTNPWCNPSTPTNSPASSPSPHSSSVYSPSVSPTESRLRSCESPAVSEMSTSSYSTGSSSGSETGIHSTSSFSKVEKPRCINPTSTNINEIARLGRAISSITNQHSTEDSSQFKTVTEDKVAQGIHAPILPVDINSHFLYRVSFEYEETLDSLLENGKIKSDSFASIKDLYEENAADDCSNYSLGSIGSTSLEDEFPFYEPTDSGNGSTRGSLLDTKSPLCYSIEEEFTNMDFRGSFNEEDLDFGKFRSEECLTDSASSTAGDSTRMLFDERPDSSGSGTCIGCSDDSGSTRSLGDVKASLEEKVLKLRQEKLLVEEKIREAQEEDRIRAREKVRFQKQVTLYRKQMLLQTLKELKNKLEQQGERLQTSYSAILNIQRKFAQNNVGFQMLAMSK